MNQRVISAIASPGAPTRGITPFERLLSICTWVHGGEGRAVALLIANAFLLMLAYYLLKPVREALLLAEGGAEARSYAMAAQALVLLLLVPAYSRWANNRNNIWLVQSITLFSIGNLAVFFVLGLAGVHVALAFFIWLGIFSVFIVAQFWAFTADLYRLESGRRLFPAIMAGAATGAWAGSRVSGALFDTMGPWGLMWLAGLALFMTLSLTSRAAGAVPDSARRPQSDRRKSEEDHGCGFRLVLGDRYLLLIAVSVVLLNCISSTGEYILASRAIEHADAMIATGNGLNRGVILAEFYAEFYSWVCALNIGFQLLLVSRIFKVAGVSGALLVLPVIAAVGYGLIAFIPVFSFIAVIKVVENSANYSLHNTARQALFLATGRAARFQGKTAIETFFWRFGDLLQASVIFAGVNLFDFQIRHFALLNAALAVVWLIVVHAIGRRHRALVQQEAGT